LRTSLASLPSNSRLRDATSSLLKPLFGAASISWLLLAVVEIPIAVYLPGNAVNRLIIYQKIRWALPALQPSKS